MRGPALLALQPTLRSLLFRERVVVDLLPILREPDALMKYPDHRGDAANAAMMARMRPRVAAQINGARNQPVFAPIGPELLRLLAPSAAQQDAVDEAILAFLARPDQTPQTLREVVRSISLNPQDERLNQAVGSRWPCSHRHFPPKRFHTCPALRWSRHFSNGRRYA